MANPRLSIPAVHLDDVHSGPNPDNADYHDDSIGVAIPDMPNMSMPISSPGRFVDQRSGQVYLQAPQIPSAAVPERAPEEPESDSISSDWQNSSSLGGQQTTESDHRENFGAVSVRSLPVSPADSTSSDENTTGIRRNSNHVENVVNNKPRSPYRSLRKNAKYDANTAGNHSNSNHVDEAVNSKPSSSYRSLRMNASGLPPSRRGSYNQQKGFRSKIGRCLRMLYLRKRSGL